MPKNKVCYRRKIQFRLIVKVNKKLQTVNNLKWNKINLIYPLQYKHTVHTLLDVKYENYKSNQT